jgi:predicted Fe-S protein YdhL (DUF1289 family)
VSHGPDGIRSLLAARLTACRGCQLASLNIWQTTSADNDTQAEIVSLDAFKAARAERAVNDAFASMTELLAA